MTYGREQGQTPSVCSRHFFLRRGDQEVREDTVFQNPSERRTDTTGTGAPLLWEGLRKWETLHSSGCQWAWEIHPKSHSLAGFLLVAWGWHLDRWGEGCWGWCRVIQGVLPLGRNGHSGTQDQQQMCLHFCLSRAYPGKWNKHIIKEGGIQEWFFCHFSSVYFRKCCPHRWGWQQQLSLAVIADSKLPVMIFLQWKQS